jgi:ferritin-like metal-binding protein YciE
MVLRKAGNTQRMSFQNTTNTTSDDSDRAGDERHTIATYLGDMLALERHIAGPIASQLNSQDHREYADAIALIERIRAITENHIAALDARLNEVGGSAGSGLKSAWSQVLGGGAAALNQVRKTKVSKSLRDDYTALGLAAISYTMLHATAQGLGDERSAALAKRHLADITPVIVAISRQIAGVVLAELRDDGENVVVSAAHITQEETQETWGATSGQAGSGTPGRTV